MNLNKFSSQISEYVKKTYIKSKITIFNALSEKETLILVTFVTCVFMFYIMWYSYTISSALVYIGVFIASNGVLWRALYNSFFRKILSSIVAIVWTSYVLFLISFFVVGISYNVFLEIFNSKYLFTIGYIVFDYVLVHVNYIISAILFIYMLKRISNFLQDLVNQIICAIERINSIDESQ